MIKFRKYYIFIAVIFVNFFLFSMNAKANILYDITRVNLTDDDLIIKGWAIIHNTNNIYPKHELTVYEEGNAIYQLTTESGNSRAKRLATDLYNVMCTRQQGKCVESLSYHYTDVGFEFRVNKDIFKEDKIYTFNMAILLEEDGNYVSKEYISGIRIYKNRVFCNGSPIRSNGQCGRNLIVYNMATTATITSFDSISKFVQKKPEQTCIIGETCGFNGSTGNNGQFTFRNGDTYEIDSDYDPEEVVYTTRKEDDTLEQVYFEDYFSYPLKIDRVLYGENYICPNKDISDITGQAYSGDACTGWAYASWLIPDSEPFAIGDGISTSRNNSCNNLSYEHQLSCGAKLAGNPNPTCNAYEGKVKGRDADNKRVTYSCRIEKKETISTDPFPGKVVTMRSRTFPLRPELTIYRKVEYSNPIVEGTCPQECERKKVNGEWERVCEDSPECETIRDECDAYTADNFSSEELIEGNVGVSIYADLAYNPGTPEVEQVSKTLRTRTDKITYNLKTLAAEKWTNKIGPAGSFLRSTLLGNVFFVNSGARIGYNNFRIGTTINKTSITNTINYSCPYQVTYTGIRRPGECKAFPVGSEEYICCINPDRCDNRCEGLTDDAKDCCEDSSLPKCNDGGSCSGLTGNAYLCCKNPDETICKSCVGLNGDDYTCCIDPLNSICSDEGINPEGVGYFVRQISLTNPFPRTSILRVGNNWKSFVYQAGFNSLKMKDTTRGPIKPSTATYTNDNLEFSFTLTPAGILDIKNYNNSNRNISGGKNTTVERDRYMDDSVGNNGRSQFIDYYMGLGRSNNSVKITIGERGR